MTTKKKRRNAKFSPGPGAPWTHTSLEEIAKFRAENNMTEAATARTLGVSVGTLRNWTLHGKTAMAKMQRRVHKVILSYKVMDGPLVVAPTKPKSRSRPKAQGPKNESLVAELVAAYIRRGGTIRGDLIDYIERVKQALVA